MDLLRHSREATAAELANAAAGRRFTVRTASCGGARHRDAAHNGAVDAPARELLEGREGAPHGLRLHSRLEETSR